MVDVLIVTEVSGALGVHAVRVGILWFVYDRAAILAHVLELFAGEVRGIGAVRLDI